MHSDFRELQKLCPGMMLMTASGRMMKALQQIFPFLFPGVALQLNSVAITWFRKNFFQSHKNAHGIDTVDGKNPAPLRMPQILALYQHQDLLGHPSAGIFPSTVLLFDEFSKSSFSSHFRVVLRSWVPGGNCSKRLWSSCYPGCRKKSTKGSFATWWRTQWKYLPWN